MTPILIDATGAYYCRNGAIDYVYFCFGGEGSAIERVARWLGVSVGSLKVVRNYKNLK